MSIRIRREKKKSVENRWMTQHNESNKINSFAFIFIYHYYVNRLLFFISVIVMWEINKDKKKFF